MENIPEELEAEGLRIANENEPGWFWMRIDKENGERVTLWVTDEPEK